MNPTTDYSSDQGGWILPNGDYYECRDDMLHMGIATSHGLTEQQAEDAGWIKIHWPDTYTGFKPQWIIMLDSEKRMTKRQADTLWDWALVHDEQARYIASEMIKQQEMQE